MSASDVHINSLTVHSNIQFIKLLRFIKDHPGCTRHDVLTVVRGAECDRPGFYSDYFGYMFANDYAQMKRDGVHMKYYITSRGEVLLLCAEANGPMPKRTKHSAVIKGTSIPFNPEVPKEYKNLETTVKLVNEMIKLGAYSDDYLNRNGSKMMKKEEILEILQKITGTKTGIKPLFTHLHKNNVIIKHWHKEDSEKQLFFISEPALKIANVWPLVEVSTRM